jgi:predicted acyltransferase (DUF342 family)
MNVNNNLFELTQRKKSVVLSQDGYSNKVYKYIGGDSIIYRNHYIQNQNNLDYYGHIYEHNETMYIHSSEITLYDKVNISGPLSVSNNMFIDGNLTISGNLIGVTTTIPNNLYVTGDSTFASNLSTSGLLVSNNTIINGCLTVSCLNVSNTSNLNGNLIVSGNATFASNLSTSGLSVSNDVFINGNLIVSGSVSYINLNYPGPLIYNATYISQINATYTDNSQQAQNIFSTYIVPPRSNYKVRLMGTLQVYTNDSVNNIPFASTITRTIGTTTINLANKLNITTRDITYAADSPPYNNPTNLDTSLGTMFLHSKQHSYMISLLTTDEPATTLGITYTIRVVAGHHNLVFRNGSLIIDYIVP